MSSGPECTTVELPVIYRLVGPGRDLVTGNSDAPSATGREVFRKVLTKSDLSHLTEGAA
ncbi:MAG TPA: hypothetical protein VHN14_17525 [Kofleriaceae bacterium]|jgi:hypothetical protein|nr:hypothetical protein [Kofleriaceae bacterium]